MTVVDKVVQIQPNFVDKAWLRKLINEQDTHTGFMPVPGATAKLSRQLAAEDLKAAGLTVEDCIASRGIIEMREE